jgi:hypothetical protein
MLSSDDKEQQQQSRAEVQQAFEQTPLNAVCGRSLGFRASDEIE